ncbi:hypothetical protein Dimus_006249 [Dionaea muscipula]
MTTKTADPSAPQGDSCGYPPPQAGPPEHQTSRAGNGVYKSGPLFISSKGIGWTSWKKRWFILTRTSLVFFRSDPTAIPQKSGEMNLTLGGIDLNNSGSVEVKPDKKLLTVLFPDGRDGRAFTLKAETSEDLYEWKAALESALAQAPCATLAMGQNGILKNEQADAVNGSTDQQKDRLPVKSMVIGRPILLALEDIDGSPSFLEKALRFIEVHGVKVEGILRQAADVEEVERRVREYEQGKIEFSPGEDAHIVADCVKHVLRELPSSPVPASCCSALLEAFRTDRNKRANAMRTAILETFPEPNRRLLQRILIMMQTVASHKTDNKMSTSAVAACMAPLLLRPLLAGECEVENHPFDVAGDGSFQLLQAAAAANHAQAIIITLLDEYENIFGAGVVAPEFFSDSEESGSETEATDDDDLYDDDEYGTEDHDGETDDDYDHSVSGTCTDIGDDEDGESYDYKQSNRSSLVCKSPERDDHHESIRSTASSQCSTPGHKNREAAERAINKQGVKNSVANKEMTTGTTRDLNTETRMKIESDHRPTIFQESESTRYGSGEEMRCSMLEHTPAQKNLSMESIDFPLDEEEKIKRLEAAKNELQNQIAEEANGNAILRATLEKRRKALHERRLALQKDVARLQEQLEKERELRVSLEAGLGIGLGSVSEGIDEKTKGELQEIAVAKEDLNNLKQRFDDLGTQLNQQREQNYSHQHDRNALRQEAPIKGTTLINKQKENENFKTNKQKDNESSRVNKQKDNETKAAERSIRSKEQSSQKSDGSEHDNERNYDISSLSNKNQNQQNDAAPGSSSKPGVVPGNSSSVDAPAPKLTLSSISKQLKGEGSNTSTSALSKLTARLNFLKERRNQLANELQNLDKNREPVESPRNPEKGKGSESQQLGQSTTDRNQVLEASIVQNPRDNIASQPLQEKMYATDGGSQYNQDGIRKGSSPKSHNLLHQNSDRGRKSDGQQTQHSDRVKLESQSSKNVDKGRRSEGQLSISEVQPSKGADKGRRSEGQYPNSEGGQSSKTTDKGRRSEGQYPNPEVQSSKTADKGRRSEGQYPNSEVQSSKAADKGRRSEGQYSNAEGQASKKDEKGRR